MNHPTPGSTRRFSGSIPTPYKITAVVLLAGVALAHLLNTGYGDWKSGADTAYVLGLLYLFFSRESADDERVQDLKLKALSVAFFAGWAATGAVRFAVYLQDRTTIPWTMSAYDVLFVILLLAHALYYFWRFQDGRTEGAGQRERNRGL